jgi:hypothetical protein
MISHKHHCIFVHIPKTGGSSIEDVIWPGERTEADLWMGFISRYSNKYQTGGLQHLLARQIREEVGAEVFDSYFKFTFVRNPWDKAVSQFASMRDRADLRELIGMASDASLSEYLQLTERHGHVQWNARSNSCATRIGHRWSILSDDSRISSTMRKWSLSDSAFGAAYRIGIDRSTVTTASISTIARVNGSTLTTEDFELFGYDFD